MAFYTLEAVHPITHAVGNTVKRRIHICMHSSIYNTVERRARCCNPMCLCTIDRLQPHASEAATATVRVVQVKRVILILFSVARFGTPMTTQSAIGSAIAVTGVFAYSVAKNVFKPANPAPKSA